MKIGFIGTAGAGGTMAARILKAGHTLTVNDVRRETAAPLLAAGASWADTPRDAAGMSEVVCACLPGEAEAEAAALGEAGVIEGIRPGAVFIDFSINSPPALRRIYGLFRERGAHVLDAYVSASGGDAKSGKPMVTAGGTRKSSSNAGPSSRPSQQRRATRGGSGAAPSAG